jgi:predicted TIM-barrel fold metal-dependent hydrolase
MTSYGDKWLGYAEFEPVWEELSRRKATVYTHPTTANCCANLVRGIDDAHIEFGADTARSIFSVIFSGTSQKYKDVNWIWSHGGRCTYRLCRPVLFLAVSRPPYEGKFTRATVEGELRRFYYDTAQVANPITLSAMVQLMPIAQIVYGTDFPYRIAADNTRGVSAFFKGADLKAVVRDNTLRLIPRLQGA